MVGPKCPESLLIVPARNHCSQVLASVSACRPFNLDPEPWTLSPGTWSLNLEPGTWTLDPGPWTLNLEPGTWNLEPGTWTLEPGTWNLDPGTCNLEPGTWNLELGPAHQHRARHTGTISLMT